ncbi:hypothetical protein FZ938_19470 [Azospirillum oryzae]|nr:hypothetical protein FZ938_19470 [Azospirillum oryzae]
MRRGHFLRKAPSAVIPAQAGIQPFQQFPRKVSWFPACAGMTAESGPRREAETKIPSSAILRRRGATDRSHIQWQPSMATPGGRMMTVTRT